MLCHYLTSDKTITETVLGLSLVTIHYRLKFLKNWANICSFQSIYSNVTTAKLAWEYWILHHSSLVMHSIQYITRASHL